MKATINHNGVMVQAANLQDMRRKLMRALNIYNVRALTAITDTGATIHVELYDGQDYIRLANGRVVAC